MLKIGVIGAGHLGKIHLRLLKEIPSVKLPGNSNIYYIFNPAEATNQTGFVYSIVDLSLAGGLGAVTIKNQQLLNITDERATAIPHSNGTDVWIIATQFNGTVFQAFQLSAAGINGSPVTTNTGITVAGSDSRGYLKPSPSGNQLAMAMHFGSTFALYDFNRASGHISNPLIMTRPEYNWAYGVEFSPDGSKLYGSTCYYKYLLQWDLLAGSNTAIENSVLVIDTFSAQLGGLQVAPDSKIYLLEVNAQQMHVINDPNQLGANCNLGLNQFQVRVYCSIGLPNCYPLRIQPMAMPIANFTSGINTLCANSCAAFTDLSTDAISYHWFFPGGSPSTSTDADPQNICYSLPGSYDVTLVVSNSSGTDTLTVIGLITVLPQPSFPSLTQQGDTLFSSSGYSSYQWFLNGDSISGADSEFYVATTSGNYAVVVTDTNGCNAGASILNVVAALEDVLPDNDYNIYYDKSANEMIISSNRVSEISLVLYSANGQVVTANKFKYEYRIDCRSFSQGIYLIRIISGDAVRQHKILVSH